MTRGVGILGKGLVTALGSGSRENASALLEKRGGIAAAESLPWAKRGDLMATISSPMDGEERSAWMLERALEEALASAGLGAGRLAGAGVFVGTNTGMYQVDDFRCWEALRADPSAAVGIRSRGLGVIGARVAELAGAKGPVLNISAACVSSAIALVEAMRWIKAGLLDYALVVGFETILFTSLSGFKAMMLIDPEGCRPFDRRRAGTTLGEGCGVMVLSKDSSGGISLRGGISRFDPTSVTSHDPEGGNGSAMLEDLLAACGCGPRDVKAIKAHGTGTGENDLIEARVIKRVFSPGGEGACPPVAAIKGALGHTQGASGVVETAAWIACVESGFIPPTFGFAEADPALGLVPLTEPARAPGGIHICEFFGFGGSSAALALDCGGAIA
jgi:3-oxoacyl-[acyl-carrier-protein] synthase I